jgi:regulatory protein
LMAGRRPRDSAVMDPDADPESVARAIVLRMLEQAPRTRAELASGLARRGVPADAAAAVLDRFDEVGLVDDEAFALAWVDSRHRGRGLTRRALSEELRRKGVDHEVAAVALEQISHDDEVDAARALVRRRMAAMSRLPAEVRTRRLVGLLSRKGFGASMAYRVVREVCGEDADLAHDEGSA